MEQEVYRINEFCTLYAISRSAFYREVKANRLQIMRRGCRTFVARSDAKAWVDMQRHATKDQGMPTQKT